MISNDPDVLRELARWRLFPEAESLAARFPAEERISALLVIANEARQLSKPDPNLPVT
jgi:hypothetical protein